MHAEQAPQLLMHGAWVHTSYCCALLIPIGIHTRMPPAAKNLTSTHCLLTFPPAPTLCSFRYALAGCVDVVSVMSNVKKQVRPVPVSWLVGWLGPSWLVHCRAIWPLFQSPHLSVSVTNRTTWPLGLVWSSMSHPLPPSQLGKAAWASLL